MTAISQQDWQDQEDGRALRELREALPDGWSVLVRWMRLSGSWNVKATDSVRERVAEGPTIAAAADACRARLRAAARGSCE